ncbi:MAG: LON peptidase substrate-binding domain-containing protein [Acidimicrobiales bacterium]
MFPLSTVLYPGAPLALHVFEPRYQALMADCRSSGRTFGVVLISRGSEVGGGDQRVGLGTEASVVEGHPLGGGRLAVLARGLERIRIVRWVAEDPYPCAVVQTVTDGNVAGGSGSLGPAMDEARRAVVRLRSLLSELCDIPALPHDLDLSGDEGATGWTLCELAPLNLLDRQRLLGCHDGLTRMRLLCELCTAMADDVTSLLGGHGC